jgi:hypothetical protein
MSTRNKTPSVTTRCPCRSAVIAALRSTGQRRWFAGMTVLMTVLVMFVMEIGQGNDGSPTASWVQWAG